MSNENRKIMRSNIAKMVPVHGMKRFKDPSKSSLKADEWLDWIVTVSVEATAGLIDDRVLEIWIKLREAMIIYIGFEPMNLQRRNKAKQLLKEVAIAVERNMPETMLTVSFHHLVIEADNQINFTGPIKEAMSSWIERICFDCVEPTKRRRLCNAPEKTIIRSFLIRHYLNSHESSLPKISDYMPLSSDQKLDQGDQNSKVLLHFLFSSFSISEFFFLWFIQMLGIGNRRLLKPQEKVHLREYLRNYDLFVDGDDIPESATFFKRGFFKSELHSPEYSRTRSRCSTNVAIRYTVQEGQKDYFGRIDNFLMVDFKQQTYRLAFVTVFYQRPPNPHGTHRIDHNKEYKTGKCVPLDTIDRKVLFFKKENETLVLEIPVHLSKK